MKRTGWIKGLICAAVVAAIGNVATSAQEATALKPQELSAIKAQVSKAAAVKMWVVTQEFTGSFEDIGKAKQEFQEEWERQKPLGANATFKATGILILNEDPTGKSRFKMEIGTTVPSAVKVKAPLMAHQVQFPEAVSVTHVGPYQSLASVYHAINAIKPADFPVVMELLQVPTASTTAMMAAAPGARTQLIVPLKR